MNSPSNGLPPWFLNSLGLAESVAAEIGVLLVANVQNRTIPIDDYERDTIITEFLAATELDELIEGFAKAGIYCKAILDEEGFLRWLDCERTQFPRPRILVYNLAQNGTGPARLTLIPGLCRLHHLLLVDSNAYAVSLARHKFHSAMVLQQSGLPVARTWWFTDYGWWPEPPPEGMRLIAKPTYESASIGIHEDSVFIMDGNEIKYLAERRTTFRQPITVQEFVCGYEVEVPVFEHDGIHSLMAVGIESDGHRLLNDSIMEYQKIALDQYSFYDFASEHEGAARDAMLIACKAFHGLGLNGIGRIDFRVRPDGVPIIIEVACKPHLTIHSSFTYAVKQTGRSHQDLLKFLVGSATNRHGLAG